MMVPPGFVFVYCSDVRAVGYGEDCCDSCHDDMDEFGYDAVGPDGDDYQFETCCAVARWLDEHKEKVADAIKLKREKVEKE